ncbi:DUF1189 family protein [Candidatus Woesearchaeota archaeon]|jgi:hypothetical protein|nr:DUF1189 family protein [Candidatus Woesearchaeota archaeon]MBT3538124.1 DUF1189 family protein [Candidatus Woesearchaeota archaeon]MBT4697517.1 DUF1189 family protein [Candidatus Woesearchaeota archaeon]MBT4717364.1 DUF1189 family protein [Candidatus Woesearchaeota archaeon]MBT7105793.1 DUF1189 family protein [Candidatus Woesearchaeota archaeon]
MLSRKKVYKQKGWNINPSIEQFIRTVARSFNPRSYKDLSVAIVGNSVKHFFTLLLWVFVISLILFIPALFGLSEYVEGKLDNFDSIGVDFHFSSAEPVVFGEKEALVTFGEGNESEADGLLVFDGTNFMYDKLFGYKKISMSLFNDFKANKSEVSSFVSKVLLLMSPLLALLAFVYFSLKYLIFVLLGTVIILVLSRLFRFEINFNELFNIGIYALTPMILLELLTLPLSGVNLPYIPFVLFVLYFLLGTILVGSFQEGHHSKPVRKKSTSAGSPHYIDVHRIK